jgi:hypothetical protein
MAGLKIFPFQYVCSIVDMTASVNRTAYMDFRKATDELFNGISHSELAKELGVSIPSIRQARLRSDAAAHRTPPDGWENAVKKLAEDRIKHYQRLADRLRNGR